MLKHISLALAAAITLISTANADCHFYNAISNVDPRPTDEPYCYTQDPGNWMLTLDVAAVNFPTFDADNPNAGAVSNWIFTLYDHTCTPRGVYFKGLQEEDTNKCGVDYHIHEPWMNGHIVIYWVFFNVGGPRFTAFYQENEYEHWGREDVSSGLHAEVVTWIMFPGPPFA